MKNFYYLIVSLAFLASSAFAQEADYSVRNNGTRTFDNYDVTRDIGSISIGEQVLTLDDAQKKLEYFDATGLMVFEVEPGQELKVEIGRVANIWSHHYVYIDTDFNGFTASVDADGWTPAGDLVAYSFYNNDGASDETGWNSAGAVVTGNERMEPAVPSFKAPEKEGVYHMRIKQDWCNIDPLGDADGKFGDFTANGGQIIDVMLQVGDPVTGVAVLAADEAQEVYDLTGRRIDSITKAGIYIVNGSKVLVK